MAVDDLAASAVCAAFDLGRPVEAPTFVARGAMGEVWKVVTETGAWAAKSLFEWVEPPARPTDVDVQLAAHAAGIRLPLPILAAGGAAVVGVSGRRHRVYEWVDLDASLALPATPARAAEAGALLGRLHQLDVDAEDEVDDWYTTAAPAGELAAIGERATASGRPWAPAFVEALPVVEVLLRYVADEHAEARLCHRDVNPSNLLPAAGDGPLVVLDWENCGPLAPDEELASAMQVWTSGGEARLESARALLDAYRAVGGDADLDPGRSWSMAVCTSVNFLAHMGEQALADDVHRAFAEEQLRQMCDGGLRQLLESIETLTPMLG